MSGGGDNIRILNAAAQAGKSSKPLILIKYIRMAWRLLMLSRVKPLP